MAENPAAAEPDPAILAAVTEFGTLHASALQAASAQFELQERTKERTTKLEKMCLAILESKADQFLKLKHIFAMLPARMSELVMQQCGVRWRRPPLANFVVTPLTRHVTLDLSAQPGWEFREKVEEEGWTYASVIQLYKNLLTCAKELLTLTLRQSQESSYLGLSDTQLFSLLLQTRSLTAFTLRGLNHREEYDIAIGFVAAFNPGLRSLHTDCLGSAGLRAIAERCQNLRELTIKEGAFSKEEMSSALNCLPDLQEFGLDILYQNGQRHYFDVKDEVLIMAAESWDPTSPPCALTGEIVFLEGVTPRQVRQVLACFPQLDKMRVHDTDVPAVCEGLGGLTTRICKVDFYTDTTQLQPQRQFFALNRQVRDLEIRHNTDSHDHVVDLGALAGCCPDLENLVIYTCLLHPAPHYQPPEKAFSKLTKCEITLFQSDDDTNPPALSHSLVYHLLSGPLLESVEFHQFPIPEAVVAALVSADAKKEGCLSSLRSLDIEMEDVALGAAVALVSHAPRLRELVLHYIDYREVNQEHQRYREVMARFMARYLPHVTFTLQREIE